MAISHATARRFFIEKKEGEINKELIRTGKPAVKVFLGSTSNVSEEVMEDLKESYEKQGWKASFEKERSWDPFLLFSRDRDLYIVLTRK